MSVSDYNAAVVKGVCSGVDWCITDTGELIIGKEGDYQDFDYASSRSESDWDWNEYKELFDKVNFAGEVTVSGSADYMFYNPSFHEINFENFYTENAFSMDSFLECNEEVQPIYVKNMNLLTTSNVESMRNMFKGFVSDSELDFSSFDTHNVKDFSGMFQDFTFSETYSLSTSLDMSNIKNSGYGYYSGPYTMDGSRDSVFMNLETFTMKDGADVTDMFKDVNADVIRIDPSFYDGKYQKRFDIQNSERTSDEIKMLMAQVKSYQEQNKDNTGYDDFGYGGVNETSFSR